MIYMKYNAIIFWISRVTRGNSVVKRWSADIAVPSSRPVRGGSLFNR